MEPGWFHLKNVKMWCKFAMFGKMRKFVRSGCQILRNLTSENFFDKMKANIFSKIGHYSMFLRQAFRTPENRKMLRKQFVIEIDRLIMSSIIIA